ncbi:MAG: FAD-dependent thymidylate synthase [Planctomycetota bacterium]
MVTLQDVVSVMPDIRLVNAFERPYENAVATARTCYSSRGIVRTEDVSPDATSGGSKGLDPAVAARRAALRDRIARSTFEAGHHTTLQHAHFQFALRGVSRHFLWTFLHSHPFYNSEQVSQRYVEVKPGAVVVPPLEGEARAVFGRRVREQMEEYRALIEQLVPVCEHAYFERFRARRARRERYGREIRKRAQEIARYVLPVATEAWLYHTVSGLTLLRYWRMAETFDAPWEQRRVVGRMVDLLLEADPNFAKILQEPLPLEATPEYAFFEAGGLADRRRRAGRDAWAQAFDASLDGRISRLVDWKARSEEVTAQAVRDVLGLPASALGDDDAIALVLDPARNGLLGETMNVSTLAKLTRTLHHAGYTFRKRLSHTADSQDQRHRMTPASRPALFAYLSDGPDHVTPALVAGDEALSRSFDESMVRTWEAIHELERLGVAAQFRAYLLPNAVSIRFTESCDLLNLHHKLKARLCYNAQEEIWRASRDEAEQVRAVHPRLGRFLLPPCGLRHRAGRAPRCPEGSRYCGVRVWTLDPGTYARVL